MTAGDGILCLSDSIFPVSGFFLRERFICRKRGNAPKAVMLSWPRGGADGHVSAQPVGRSKRPANEAVTELNWDVVMPPTAAVVEEAARPIEESVAGGALHGSGQLRPRDCSPVSGNHRHLNVSRGHLTIPQF